MSEGRQVARAIDALRRGWPVAIGEGLGRRVLLAIETADTARLAAFDPAGDAGVLLSHERAATLNLANQREAARGAPARIARVPWLDLDAATALADPARDLATPLKGPFRVVAGGETAEAIAAIRLARLAGLLPALFVRDEGAAEVEVGAEAIMTYEDPARLRIAARARLPVEVAEHAEIVAFRSLDEATEHIALLIGAPNGAPPLVRLHSECLTGDVLGSLKCDCGPQLRAALAALAANGWGILVYLRQEGRGIGLVNKLRAYALQDQGFDTIDANIRLGFAVDTRDFAIAARMLDLLGQRRVRLLTNNPDKVAGLERAGTMVIERVPHALPPNPHNAASRHQAPARRPSFVTVLRVDAAARLIDTPLGRLPCVLGRGGVVEAEAKREGDGATPRGAWPIRGALLRPDRLPAPTTRLPWRWLREDDGWSDDAADPAYNRPVRHPYPFSAERLWRDDDLYDLIVVLGYNDAPAQAGRGSAIFLHVTPPDGATAGCVAIARDALAALLPLLAPGDCVAIS